MKNGITLLLIAFLSTKVVFSQAPDWQWARGAAGPNAQEAFNIATDVQGNVFIAGNFFNNITFGSVTLTSTSLGVYLAKFDRDGNLLWLRGGIGIGSLGAYCVSVDAAGNAYMSGRTGTHITFGPYTLTNSSGSLYQAFLVKYDANGNVLWARKAGTNNNDMAWAVHADHFGGVYICGILQSDSVAFGSHVLYLSPTGVDDVFLVKYDSSGNALWARSGTGSNANLGWAITSDLEGNAYVTGQFVSDTLIFAPDTLFNSGMNDVFFTKYDSTGTVLWSKNIGGSNDDVGYGLATDASNNVYITGYIKSQLTIIGTDSIINNSNHGMYFLAKYDGSGNFLWDKSDTAASYGYTIAVDNADNVYLSGGFNSSSIRLDTISLMRPAVYSDPSFIVKFTSSGDALWAKAVVSGGDDQNGIALGIGGDVFFGGDFWNINPFILGPDTLPLTGVENSFVSKLGFAGEPTGIIGTYAENGLRLYPNPVTNELRIQNDELKIDRIEIYNVMGEVCQSQISNLKPQISVDVSQLPPGIYFIKVQGEKEERVAKFVRQ